MNHPKTRQHLRRWFSASAGLCTALVAVCYYFVDQPVAFFVHDHYLNQFSILRWLTYLPMALNALAPAIVLWFAITQAQAPDGHVARTLFAASISLIVVLAFEYYLKFLFGRYWPVTWIDNNPSLIRDGAYGFHPFHFGSAYGSFPSGHTARTFGVVSVLWIAFPKWNWIWITLAGSVVVALVGMNYHFVGDTVGGAFLGSWVGIYTARFLYIGARTPGQRHAGCSGNPTD